MKKIVVYLLLIVFTGITFLFSVNPNNDSPNPSFPPNYVSLNQYMGFPVNYDAFAFIGGAIQPSYLLKPGYDRQLRPLYILMGSLVGYTIYYLSHPIHAKLHQLARQKFPTESGMIDDEKTILYISFYVGYIFINIILLLVSLLLFEKVVITLSGPWKNGKLLFLFLCGLLLSNQLAQHFFWTVHVQLFNILTPLLCLYISLRIIQNKISVYRIFLLTTCLGCLLLIYGNFLLLIPVLVCSYIYKSWGKFSLLKIIWQSLLLLFLFFLPLMGWSLFLTLNGIRLHSAELEKYRQFIWLSDSFNNQQISFFSVFAKNTLSYLTTFGGLLFPFFLFGLSYLFCRIGRKASKKTWHPPMNYRLSLLLPSLIALECFIFFWLLGYYADRLTDTMLALIISLIAIQINQHFISKWQRLFFCFLILGWHIYIIIISVPHFSANFYN